MPNKNLAAKLALHTFSFALLLQALGCASGQLKPLPKPETNKGVAEIVVVRNSNLLGSPNAFKVQVNGEDILSIRTAQYAILRLNAGKHTVGVKSFGGLTPTTKIDTVEFTARDGDQLYFMISPHFSKNNEIEEIPKSEAEQLIEKSELIEIQYQ